MIEFAKEARTTTFFRDYEIKKIKIAFRIMEYLAPDPVFPPKGLEKNIQDLIKLENYTSAVKFVFDEIDVDIDSSSWYETAVKEAIELMEYLHPKYKENQKNEKQKRRQELLEELRRLDEDE